MMANLKAEERGNSPERTAQQWAWEFLRRNLEYRKAWQQRSSLSPDHLEEFEKYSSNLLSFPGLVSFNLEVLKKLPLSLFEERQFSHFEDADPTIGSYVDETGEQHILAQPERLRVAPRFMLSSYCLTRWQDPNYPLDEEPDRAATLWQYEPHEEFGLISMDAPGMDQVTPNEVILNHETYMSLFDEVKAALPFSTDISGKKFVRSPAAWSDEYLGELPKIKIDQVDIRFDLSLPLTYQLEKAKETLRRQQKLLIEEGFTFQAPKVLNKNGVFDEYLDLLDDMEDRGMSALEVAEIKKNLRTFVQTKIDPKTKKKRHIKSMKDPSDPVANHEKITESTRQKIGRAKVLRDRGYKALAFIQQ